MKTYFASPERAEKKEIEHEVGIVTNNPVISGLLHSVGGILAVLNEHRQILALNDSFIRLLGIDDPSEALGLRPGEAIKCIHAHEESAGCGTSKYCSTCGAAIAIVSSLDENRPVERICALSANRGGAVLDIALLVRSHPINIDNKRYLLLFVQDITIQEQRAALERTFFHDVNNMLAMLMQASELLQSQEPSELATLIYKTSQRLHQEVAIQRCLSAEKKNDYLPLWQRIPVYEVLLDLQNFFTHHLAAKRKHLVISEVAPELEIKTDFSVLQRILINMIVNAFEATDESGLVKIWVEVADAGNELTFCVWNDKPISSDVKHRIFQRNFSTKDQPGRGIGTYSMKLFGEKILGGKVDFTSSTREGTVFRLTHPL